MKTIDALTLLSVVAVCFVIGLYLGLGLYLLTGRPDQLQPATERLKMFAPPAIFMSKTSEQLTTNE